MKIKAILFDFIGTTVKEKDSSVIIRCLTKAFTDNSIFVNPDFFNSIRGRDKHAIIKEVLNNHSLPATMEPRINDSFKKNIEINLQNFSSFEDILPVIDYISSKGILIGIGTGLSRDTFETILSHLGWKQSLFDYIGISDEIGKSRPQPDMIFHMMSALKISNPKQILKIGDTIADIQEGKNAGCLTAVVLSGTQPKDKLIEQEPDYVLNTIADLKLLMILN